MSYESFETMKMENHLIDANEVEPIDNAIQSIVRIASDFGRLH